MHIAVLGLGPAGSVLAHRAVARGWTVDGYDPACRDDGGILSLPDWRSTYGVAVDSLPQWARQLIPFASVSPTLSAHTPRTRQLRYGPYGVLDTAELRRRLAPGVRLHRRRIDGPTARSLGVDAVVDCRGVVDRHGSVRQVAYGVFLTPEDATTAGIHDVEFMDWRASPATGEPADPSFLYVQPTGGRVLVEETVLATRTPARELLPELRRRLRARLGEVMDHAVGSETVHFPTDRRRRPWYLGPDVDGVATFGAAGGLTHPATGYSVAAAVATVDNALDLISEHAGSDRSPLLRRMAPTPVRRLPQSLSAALAWRLRLLGAELIVHADGKVLPGFFDAFFSLPVALQRGYLEGHDASRVAAAMISLAAFPRHVLPFLRPLPAALRQTLRIRP